MSDSVRIEVCEKHGLRYNAAASTGCARCVREAAPSATKGPVRPTAAGIGPQVAIAIGLICTSGFLFLTVHNGIVQPFKALLGGGGASSLASFNIDDNGDEVQFELDALRLQTEALRFGSNEADPVLNAMIEELQDPAIRDDLSDEEIMERIEAVYERAWGGDDLLD